MNCSCIKGNYNFEFYALDCKHLVYQDMSDWMTEEYYSIPDTYTLNLTIPGFSSKIPIEVNTKCLNKLTSKEIYGFEGGYLSEGIYCFEVESCGVTYTRSHANICRLECKWDHLVIQMKNADDLRKVDQIRFYLDQVKFNAISNKVKKAQEFFDIASRELECVKCNC